MLSMQLLQGPVLEVRMQFNLVDGRDNRRVGKQARERRGHEITHADRAHLAVLLERAIGIKR